MTPEMSVTEMLDSFVLIAKGSRVIDRRMTNWGLLRWLPEKDVEDMVFTVANLRIYFGHRRTNRADPFKEWLTHSFRRSAPTLGDAIKFADAAARGQVAPYIDVQAILRIGNARALCSRPMAPWCDSERRDHQFAGNLVVW